MPSDNPPTAALYRAIVEQIPDALIFADREGLIRVWNQGAESVFGFSAAEVLGNSLDVIIPERLRPAHWAAYDRALESGRTRLGNAVRATRAIHRDGRTLYVDLSFGVVTDPDGRAVGSVAVGRDCTERYLAQKREKALSQGADATGSATRSSGAA